MLVGSKQPLLFNHLLKKAKPQNLSFAKRGWWDPSKVLAMSTSPRVAGGSSPSRVGRCCQDLPKLTGRAGVGQAAKLTLQEELDLIHPVFSLCWAWGCELERGSPVTVLVLVCREKKKICS